MTKQRRRLLQPQAQRRRREEPVPENGQEPLLSTYESYRAQLEQFDQIITDLLDRDNEQVASRVERPLSKKEYVLGFEQPGGE